jgi:cytochrome c peroxidase
MKSKTGNGLLNLISGILLMIPAISLFFIGAVHAEEEDIKKHYKGSLIKVTEKKLFSIEVMVPDNELRPGINDAELVLYDKDGNDVEGAGIAVTAWMPVKEQVVSDEAVITEKGGGFYRVDNIVIKSAGLWELWITVKKDGMEDRVIIEFPEIKTARAGDYAKYRKILEPLPAIPPIGADNPMSPDKVRLGKMLYWDRRISKTGETSCVSCHSPSYYGAEPMRKSAGAKGETHLRNAPTVLNAAFLNALLWTGEAPALDHQALGEAESHAAMRVSDEIAERLNRIPEYWELSVTVFGPPLTGENIGKAMAAYIRTLVTPDYPLARWLQGDEHALTENQKRGMSLFIYKGCVSCHYGPTFSNPVPHPEKEVQREDNHESRDPGVHLHKVILPGAEDDHGRARKTEREEDKYLFKVPLLLNVAKTPPYTHAGLIDNLHDMVAFMGKNMLITELSTSEVDDIAAFLHSLTGEIPVDFLTAPVLPTTVPQFRSSTEPEQ